MANSHTIRKLQTLFGSSRGFGEHTLTAYKLMQDTCIALEKQGITHFIISGTLLGHVRHDGFIPWDDDIDICVDSMLHDPTILAEFRASNPHLIIQPVGNHALKISYHQSQGGQTINKSIQPTNPSKSSNPNPKKYEYNWPFIDIFFYTQTASEPIPAILPTYRQQINFFGKDWDAHEFLPPRKIIFGGVYNAGDTQIHTYEPNNPDYFLARNYGPNYMNEIVSNGYLHKYECHNKQHAYRTTMQVYNTHKNKLDV